jgi:hypothetical protein
VENLCVYIMYNTSEEHFIACTHAKPGLAKVSDNLPRGPSSDWWVLMATNAAVTNGLMCLKDRGAFTKNLLSQDNFRPI